VAENTVRIAPPSVTVPAGGSFSVTVVANGSVDISGAGAALQFDNSRLQLTGLAKDPTMVANGASFSGFPTSPNLATFIADANAAGLIPTIAWYYTGGEYEPANADRGIFSATFSVTAVGDSTLTPVIVPGVGGMLDGRPDFYGSSVEPITPVDGSVANTPAAPTPTPTPTPEPTPTPTPSPTPVGAVDVNVTGTMDAGFVGLSCPPAIQIPLVRNTTNFKDFSCTVYSNIIWNLNANDTNTDPQTKGHMRDGSKVLGSSMHVLSGLRIVGGNPVYDYDQDLANGGIVSAGANTTNVALTLSQFVGAQDRAGSYGIQVLFSAVSGF
jgi:hypothetical protein